MPNALRPAATLACLLFLTGAAAGDDEPAEPCGCSGAQTALRPAPDPMFAGGDAGATPRPVPDPVGHGPDDDDQCEDENGEPVDPPCTAADGTTHCYRCTKHADGVVEDACEYPCDDDGNGTEESCFKCKLNAENEYTACFDCDLDGDGTNDTCPDGCNILFDDQISFLCPGGSFTFTARTCPAGGVTWSGTASPSATGITINSNTGKLSIAATVPAGTSVSLTARTRNLGFQCLRTTSVLVSDGKIGGASLADVFWGFPGAYWAADTIRDEARSWSNNNAAALGGGLGGGCADAARHAYLMCLLARHPSIGPALAKKIGDAYEFDGAGPCVDSNMDLNNNQVGRGLAANPCAAPLTPENCCQRDVISALKAGDLIILTGGPPATTPTPSGACAVVPLGGGGGGGGGGGFPLPGVGGGAYP